MIRTKLTPAMLGLVAERFKVLAEPARLEILNALRRGELTVTEIVDETGLSQGNVSKHLKLLNAQGFVARRKEGLHVYYELADPLVFRLCDLMCDQLQAQARSHRRLLAS
jgi:DNA-binding transcriptional ArsR family regulator